MHEVIGIKLCIYNTFLVLAKDLHMSRIYIIRAMAPDKSVILTKFVQCLH